MSSLGPLRAISIVSSSQAVNIIISIIRMKLIAVMLGPAGVGLLGVFNNIKDIGSVFGGLGLATSGVRQIAQDSKCLDTQNKTRKLLITSFVIQGGLSALVIWLMRDILTNQFLAGSIDARDIGVIAIAVWVGLVASAMSAVIQGMRRIADLVWVTVSGAFIGTVVGLVAVLLLEDQGLPYLVLALALGQLISAIWFLRRIEKPVQCSAFLVQEQISKWGSMVRIGIAFMSGALLTTATLLLVRGMINQRLGTDALGQFEAAWALSITYIGFVLTAMSTDYFPRLSNAINDHKVANAMINDQLQLALILGGPLILVTIGLAPIMLNVLYSSEFSNASSLLQMMTLGNLFKLVSWSLGFTVVAKGRSGLFMLIELSFCLSFIGFLWWQIDNFNSQIIGVAFIFAYAVHMIATFIAARSMVDFKWEKISLWLLLSYSVSVVALFFLARAAPIVGGIAALALAGFSVVLGLRFLIATRGHSNQTARRIENFFEFIGWRIHSNAQE